MEVEEGTLASPPSSAIISGTILWSNSTPFDGYLHLGLVLPQNSDGQWPTTTFAGQFPPQRLPLWTVIPITAGIPDQQTKVFFNSALEPPNSQYVAYWYDLNRRQIFPATGNTPTPFTISTSPFAISNPTLTVPATSSTLPTPDSSNSGLGV